MFGIVFFRLWFLQILSGQEFVAQANDNRLSTVKVVAPRGNIVDRHGEVIVDNRPGRAVGIRLMDVPEGELDTELERLARVRQDAPQGACASEIMDYLQPSTLEQNEDGALDSFFTWENVVDGKDVTGLDLIVVKQDVEHEGRCRTSRSTRCRSPASRSRDEYLRSYPQGDMAAQLLGHLGEVSADQLETQHFKGYNVGDVVG